MSNTTLTCITAAVVGIAAIAAMVATGVPLSRSEAAAERPKECLSLVIRNGNDIIARQEGSRLIDHETHAEVEIGALDRVQDLGCD